MPKPRYAQVSLEATPYYHCIARCVRRAYLCGTDVSTGECYEHRRQWLEDRLLEVGAIFAIDVYTFAIMSNHYHVVVRYLSVTSLVIRWAKLRLIHLKNRLKNADYD